MKYNLETNRKHARRLIGFNYAAPGYYFVTICTQHRECIYGDVLNGIMVLNDAGKMVKREWINLLRRFSHIRLDNFVVMPNHIHGIIHIQGDSPFDAISDYLKNRVIIINKFDSSEQPKGTTENSIGRIIQAFKSISTDIYCESVKKGHWPPFDKHLWQQNYHDRIIRDAEELEYVRGYIKDNPTNWLIDDNNPVNVERKTKK